MPEISSSYSLKVVTRTQDANSKKTMKIVPVVNENLKMLTTRKMDPRTSSMTFVWSVQQTTEDPVSDLISSLDNIWMVSIVNNLKRIYCLMNLNLVLRHYSYLNEDRRGNDSENVSLNSQKKIIIRGTIQESVLGPTMWNIVLDTSMLDGFTFFLRWWLDHQIEW